MLYQEVDELAKALDDRVTAVILEPVQGEGGVVPADPGYLREVRALCTERDVLLILDEVQTGLGRTGRWWGFEHAGIRPDVVTMAKALGNGMPIGACWATEEAAVFKPGDHATTYGGQPLAARAALAVLDVMERERIPERAAAAGERLTAALEATPGVASVRGLGMLVAAQLDDGLDAKAVAATCIERGLVLNAVTPTALRMAPSLLITDDEIARGVAILAGVLADAIAVGSPAP